MSGRAHANCFTCSFPRKAIGVGKVRITKEAQRRPPRGDGLPDGGIPTARIERLLVRKAAFSPNRRGWARFYRWQDWFGRRLTLQAKLCRWHEKPSPTPDGAYAGHDAGRS